MILVLPIASVGSEPYIEDASVSSPPVDNAIIDGSYHTFSEVESDLLGVASSYPDITKLVSIGKTYEGRDIWALKISDNPDIEEDEPEIMYNAAHHAREWMTIEVCMCLINTLVENYTSNVTIRDIVDNRQIWIIPTVNPDGRVFDGGEDPANYKNWRKNRVDNGDGTFGVDLNRNYEYMWGGAGASDVTSSNVYRGPRPFSENETLAIKNLVEEHDFTFSISYHSSSQLILYPWGYTLNSTVDDELFVSLANQMASRITNTAGSASPGYTPLQGSGLYTTSGTDDDWLYGEEGIYSFTFELYPHWSDGLVEPAVQSPYNGFHPREDKILPVCNDNIPAALFLAQVADNPYQFISHVSLNSLVTDMLINQRESGEFLIEVLNDGNLDDTFDLSFSNVPGLTIDLSPGTMNLDSSVSANAILNITPAANAEGIYEILVKATSTSDSDVTDSLTFTVTVPYLNDVGVEAIDPFSEGLEYPMGNYSIGATVKNFGERTQSFETSLEVFKFGPSEVRSITFEDAEDFSTDWTAVDLDGPSSPTRWHMTPKANNSGIKSWWAGNPVGNRYSNDACQLLRSPTFDLSEALAAEFRFHHKFRMETSYDFGSIDLYNGSAWQNLVTFTGVQMSFSEHVIDLDPYIGLNDLRVRFRFTSDGGLTDEGWFVDDMNVSATFPTFAPVYGPVDRTASWLTPDSTNDMSWKYKLREGGDFRVVATTLLANDANPSNDNFVVNLKVNDSKYRIFLYEGMNLISLPLILKNESIESVFAPISGKYDIVWSYVTWDSGDPWKSFNPSKSLNDLSEVNHTMALWVNALEDTFLDITGSLSAGTAVNLVVGWNFVGYPSMTDLRIADAFSSVPYERIEGWDALEPGKLTLLDGSHWLTSSFGIWVKMSAPSIWNISP
jgi:hypothetical protein